VESESPLYVMGGGNPTVPSVHTGDQQYGLGASGCRLSPKMGECIPETISELDRLLRN